MSSRLYMDMHVHAPVTEGLRRRGVDIVTSQEDGTRTADDSALFARAVELGRVLFTQDEDLLVLTAEWQSTWREFPGLIYAYPLHASQSRARQQAVFTEIRCRSLTVAARKRLVQRAASPLPPRRERASGNFGGIRPFWQYAG